jgi:Flp pilus assembly protein TadG
MVTARPVRRGGEGGAAAVEFAILLPLLVALLFGFIQFGIAFSNKIQATNAAREGARMAAVGITDWDDVNGTGESFWQIVQDRAGGITLSSCSVGNPGSTNAIGGTVTVSFDYPVDLVIPFVPLPASWNTGHAEAKMRIEQPSVLPMPGTCP